jgi:predicted MFS family arabinose efflux permease
LVIALGAVSANTMGYLIPDLMQDLGISRASAGLITGIFFGATGAGAFAASGIVQRLGPHRALVAASLAVTLLAVASSAAGTYWVLLVYGLGCGFAYSVATVGTNVAVAAVVTERRRGVALTAKTSLAPLFSGLSSILVGIFVDGVGWRRIMLVIAVLCLAVATNSAVSLPRTVSATSTRADQQLTSGVRPIVYVYGAAVFLSSGGGSAFFLWIVPFLKQDLDLDSRGSGLVAGAMTMASAIGMVCIASISDRLGVRRRFDVIIGLTTLCGFAATFLVLGDGLSSPIAFTLLAIGVLTVATNSGLMHAAIVELAPRSVASATGITLTGYYLGAFIAPYLFGFVADHRSYAAAWLASGVALCVSTLLLSIIRVSYLRASLSGRSIGGA